MFRKSSMSAVLILSMKSCAPSFPLSARKTNIQKYGMCEFLAFPVMRSGIYQDQRQLILPLHTTLFPSLRSHALFVGYPLNKSAQIDCLAVSLIALYIHINRIFDLYEWVQPTNTVYLFFVFCRVAWYSGNTVYGKTPRGNDTLGVMCI